MAKLDDYPVPAAQVIGRLLDNEAVLVLPAKGKVKVLNELGARIWQLADGRRTIRQIAAQVCAEYQVEPGQAEADALAFVDELVQREVFTLASQPAAGAEA